MTVEVDLSNPLLPDTKITVENFVCSSFWQPFEFESVHFICCHCGRVGHRSISCSFVSPFAQPSQCDTPATLTPQSSVDIEMASARDGKL